MARAVHVALAAHPANSPRFRQHIDVSLQQTDNGGLALGYVIRGLNLDLRVPTPHAPAPADALWSTTCCELFVAPAGQESYREFNFSPSGQWAAYDFTDTRVRAAHAPVLPAPAIVTRRTEELLELDVTLQTSAMPAGDGHHSIALATVLEAEGGHLGYWALVHPPGKPDFHDPRGFLLKLDARGLHP